MLCHLVLSWGIILISNLNWLGENSELVLQEVLGLDFMVVSV